MGRKGTGVGIAIAALLGIYLWRKRTKPPEPPPDGNGGEPPPGGIDIDVALGWDTSQPFESGSTHLATVTVTNTGYVTVEAFVLIQSMGFLTHEHYIGSEGNPLILPVGQSHTESFEAIMQTVTYAEEHYPVTYQPAVRNPGETIWHVLQRGDLGQVRVKPVTSPPTPPPEPPPSPEELVVGEPEDIATNPIHISGWDHTIINWGNRAVADGVLTSVRFAVVGDRPATLKIGTFEMERRPRAPAGYWHWYRVRDYVTLENLGPGVHDIPVTLQVRRGDFIGFYGVPGKVLPGESYKGSFPEWYDGRYGGTLGQGHMLCLHQDVFAIGDWVRAGHSYVQGKGLTEDFAPTVGPWYCCQGRGYKV